MSLEAFEKPRSSNRLRVWVRSRQKVTTALVEKKKSLNFCCFHGAEVPKLEISGPVFSSRHFLNSKAIQPRKIMV